MSTLLVVLALPLFLVGGLIGYIAVVACRVTQRLNEEDDD